jgi:hypothetical protein
MTDEEKRVRNAAYYQTHKAELVARQAAYYEEHKAEVAARGAAYRAEHKAEIAAKKAVYYIANREQFAAYQQAPAGKKTHTISKWKRYGLVHQDFNSLYEQYLQATKCDVCKTDFKDTFDRCMDHCHDTGLFRQFLCRACNIRDSWKKYIL